MSVEVKYCQIINNQPFLSFCGDRHVSRREKPTGEKIGMASDILIGRRGGLAYP